MKKKIIIVFFIAVCLAMGGVFSSQKAYADPHMCWVPYNVKAGSWATGLHITANWFATETFTIRFARTGQPYATVQLDLADHPGGWTGMVQDLLPDPSDFQSPSILLIYSTLGYFMVTQFVTSGVGFGFQTFYSWPTSSEWPNSTTLSEPSSEPQGADGMPSYSDAIPYME